MNKNVHILRSLLNISIWVQILKVKLGRFVDSQLKKNEREHEQFRADKNESHLIENRHQIIKFILLIATSLQKYLSLTHSTLV